MDGRPQKAQRLANFASKKEVSDTLHHRTTEAGECTESVCNGSLMNIRRVSSAPRSASEVLAQAKSFLDEYYASIKGCGSEEHLARWREVEMGVKARGTYRLTTQELEYGAKLAWRNAPRCIGRIQWTRLQVFDCRDVVTPQEMFDAICRHIEYATNDGNIRSAITVFPERRFGARDFRVWNQQLISYAGYENPDGSVIGDPAYVKFTQMCEDMGWRGPRGRFDVLPLVLSAATGDPQWFQIPEELVLRVTLQHPEYEWFKELGLEWFAIPAVSSMLFDCGGVEFPAAPFNGWYMSSEIASRDLCDTQRYDILQSVAEMMGLDTRSNVTLWKDKVSLEVNTAVLHSFQVAKVTLVDHHTVSESFIQFMDNEHRQRGGCPADWVWIVPPISGSLTPVFHQEMSLYYLKPAYEYQEPGWLTHARQTKALLGQGDDALRTKRIFRKVIIGVLFASTLNRSILTRRTRVTILYATETGKSQLYAHYLSDVFKKNFNPNVRCMVDYEVNRTNLGSEALILVLASTTGAGEPPQNGMEFIKNLYDVKEKDDTATPDDQKLTFWQHYNNNKDGSGAPEEGNSLEKKSHAQHKGWRNGISKFLPKLRRRWNDGRDSGSSSPVHIGPAAGVKFAVFALGSSNYKHFCAFGKYADHLLQEAGGHRIFPLTCGDDLDNQEHAFHSWAAQVFKTAAGTFDVEDSESDGVMSLESLTPDMVKFSPARNSQSLVEGLSNIHGKKIQTSRVVESKILHEEGNRWSQMLVVGADEGAEIQYQPGDHVGILPANSPEMVAFLLSRLRGCPDVDEPVQVLLQRRHKTAGESWCRHPRLPVVSLRAMLSRYLDITTPPTPALLRFLAAYATNNRHASRLKQLATDSEEYRHWRSSHSPHLTEVLEEFRIVEVEATMLVMFLPLLQPRYYSISSSPHLQPGHIHLTIAGLRYHTRGGSGPVHQGVATGFLKELTPGSNVELFHNSAPSFHLPRDLTVPVMLVAAGSGIAPFRGFWQHYYDTRTQHKGKEFKEYCHNKGATGELTLFYGCRSHDEDLYAEEKWDMMRSGALTRTHLALSRDPQIPKSYVQDLLLVYGREVSRHLLDEDGHIYICGSQNMADGVQDTLRLILQNHGHLSQEKAVTFLSQLKEENRYHEDVFGIRVHE